MIKFTPTKDFVSKEFKSVYVRGLSYTVREGNTKLLAAVSRWLEEGLVKVKTDAGAPMEARRASMEGRGEVMTITKDDIGEFKV